MTADFDETDRFEQAPALDKAMEFDLYQVMWFKQALWRTELGQTMAQIGEDEEECQQE